MSCSKEPAPLAGGARRTYLFYLRTRGAQSEKFAHILPHSSHLKTLGFIVSDASCTVLGQIVSPYPAADSI